MPKLHLTRAVEDQTWREGIIERLVRIEEGLVPRDEMVAMRTAFEDLHRFLRGDGQPGLCQKHGDQIDELRTQITAIERKQTWIMGAAAGISGLLSLGLGRILHWWGK